MICTSGSAAGGHPGAGTDWTASGWRCPGTERRPAARGSEPPHLLAVAALLPNKDQSLLLDALARLHGSAVDGGPRRLGLPQTPTTPPGSGSGGPLGLRDRVQHSRRTARRGAGSRMGRAPTSAC